MRKSKSVSVGFVASTAAVFVTGCGGESATCVDRSGRVVDSTICDVIADRATNSGYDEELCRDPSFSDGPLCNDPLFVGDKRYRRVERSLDEDADRDYFVVYGGSVERGRVKGGKRYAASSRQVTTRGGFGKSARSSGGGTSGSRSVGG